MSVQNKTKINQLYSILPEGCVVPSKWLRLKGYSPQLVARYVKSGWLIPVAYGLYKRPGRESLWQDIVISLQKFAGKDIHCGAKTALQAQGYGHFLPLKSESIITLFSKVTVHLPLWVNKVALLEGFQLTSGSLFTDTIHPDSIINLEWAKSPLPIEVSCPERAILELLSKVPYDESFESAIYFAEGLTHLRPDVLMNLLQACGNIKVKRIFLFLAERLHMPWFDRLDTDTIDLGSGKREIVKGGKLDKKYLITVPEIQ